MEKTLRRRHAAAIYMVTALLLSLISRISSLSVTVNDVECVYEYVLYEGDTVSGNFVVVDHDIFWGSDHPGIDFIVTSPADNTVHTVKGTSGDKFEFKAPRSGMFKFCFHNPYSTPETVSFYIHVGHIPNEHNLAKDEHLDPINVKIAELGEALESVTAEQKYLKARDARHRHTNESTRKRVIGYTLGEYLVLAMVSALQVVYIRRLFSKSVAYNRV
ncbi:EMP24_GP25L domain-containing protein [Cephalotus follicularis]|uniref:EMP24_GP25L domain-containing protein n=1 Tax=Cephalotus follicularis TaxID=3775 RepID=A0A1Q3AP84_CEPFO|nr:EMP24_GP25L domain-containing protein [Cephalotus follicularis]